MLRCRLNLNDRYALAALKTPSRTVATRLYGKDKDWRSAAPLHVYVEIGSVKADAVKVQPKCAAGAILERGESSPRVRQGIDARDAPPWSLHPLLKQRA
jgi:hypothetical protein